MKKDSKNDTKALDTDYSVSPDIDFKKVNTKKMSLQEIENIKEKIENVHVDFLEIVDKVDIAAESYRVLLILGENELVYDNGEFYIGETLKSDSRKKISRKQAQSIFVDYYVRHHINADVKEKVEHTEIQKEEVEQKSQTGKVIEVKGIAADILNKRNEDLEKNKVVQKKEIEEQIELM